MKLAVVNSNPDLVEILKQLLEEDGHVVTTAHIADWKRDPEKIGAFFRAERPEVVVYDIAIPYEQDWDFFRNVVRRHPDARGTRFVLTTTNLRVLQSLVGDVDVLEVVGKPYDLDRILRSVRYGSSSSPLAGKPAS